MKNNSSHVMAQADPVQPLSIQWIDLKRAGIVRQHPDEDCLQKSITGIVDKYNGKKRDKDSNPGYVLREDCKIKTIGGYSVKMFCCDKGTISDFRKQMIVSASETKTSSSVTFFYRHQPSVRIIALTTNNAWLVVRPYVNYSFPVKVVEKVCNPNKMKKIKKRCLLKGSTQNTSIHPCEFDLEKTSNMYYFVESFTSEIKSNSELFSKIKSMTKLDSCWISVTRAGIIRIEARLRIKDYAAILDLFANYMEGKPTNGREKDPSFEFLHYFQLAHLPKSELDKRLIKSIFSQYEQNKEMQIHVRHKYLEDFLFSNSFEIKIGSSSFKKIGSKPPTIKEIINEIPHANEEEFMEAIQTSELRFKNQALREYKEKIIDCLEGELRIDEDLHFKIRKTWYVFGWDYLTLLHEDFTKVIKNALIKGKKDGRLPIEWKGNSEKESEEMYNRKYLNEDGYLVFDRICPDNIEPCDILKYTNAAVYLYHVKEKFGQQTRDVCSQILNAARKIRSALKTRRSPNYLQKLWTQAMNFSSVSSSSRNGTTTLPEDPENWRSIIKSKLECLGEEDFMNIFRKPKIVFVYAFLPRPNNSLSNFLKAIDKPIKERIKNKLIESGNLDSYGRLTNTFFSTNKRDFALEGVPKKTSERIYDHLAERQYSRSTLAKMELVNLAQSLRELDFEFKICEIPRPKKAQNIVRMSLTF